MVAILGLTLRIYFRRIEIAGLEHVPKTSPVIFVLNHPNALVDPIFLLCLVPRKVCFLAKAPLFRTPVLGFFVRSIDSLPAYRRQDQGEDVSKNEETFAAARRLLASGATIGICPEGVSHDGTSMRPIKTGAARIALGAVSTGEVKDLKIVPAGLYYTAKTTFRSAALLYFGKPIDVIPVELAANGDLPRGPVRELSNQIETALRSVVLEAQHEEALATISRAEKIFSAENESDDSESSLATELQLRKRFVKGYTALSEQAPERLRQLEARITRFEQQLDQAGVDPEDLSPPKSGASVLGKLLTRSVVFLLLLGPALLGIVTHFPAYRLGGYLSIRISKTEEDVISTAKIISAMLFFPLTWLILSVAVFEIAGWLAALAILVILPLTGYLAIRFLEESDKFLGGLRALAFFLVRRRFFMRLLAERRAIKAEILALGEAASLLSR